MFFRAFRKPTSPPDDAAWWRDADAAEHAPTAASLQALRTRMVPVDVSPDEAERQDEMMDALERLLGIASQTILPSVATQHRVIGHAMCHFVAPAGLAGEIDAPGKIFITSTALVFAGSRVHSWPWHRVRSITRIQRALVIAIAGLPEPVQVVCNSYGDAMAARHLAARLRPA
jgi:hypothetical protein